MEKAFVRNVENSVLLGQRRIKGKKIIDFFPYYEHSDGKLWKGDSLLWLQTIPAESVDMIFADPPYNIKKAVWDTFESQEKYIEFSIGWIREAARILKPTGSLFVCGFSEILADIKYPASKFFHSCRWIVWHYRNKANLGGDWGRSHESILHFRKTRNFTFNIDAIRIPYNGHTLKYPNHPQAATSVFGNGEKKTDGWIPNSLGAKPKDVLEIPRDIIECPTTCNGMHEKTPHPTQKPEELLRKIILSSSHIGDVILDPFCGSGTTPVCAQQLQRKWMACDLSQEYLDWTIKRIESVENQDVEQWIRYDLENQKRRLRIK